MSRTIKAFRIFLRKSENVLEFNFTEFFLKIENTKNKFRKIGGYPLAFHNLYQHDNGYITFSIYKYRDDYKPYIEDIKTGKIKQPDGRVIEITNILYHSNFDIVLIEHNIEGSNKSRIVDYLSSFLPSEVSLEIEEIYCHYDIESIKKSDRIKYIELFLDSNTILNQNLKTNFKKDSIDISSLFLSKESSKIGSDKISLKYDIEQYGGSLNREAVSELLKVLRENILISDVGIYFKDSKKKMIKVKLSQLQSPITFTIFKNDKLEKKPSWERIKDEMIKGYKENENICYNEVIKITDKIKKKKEKIEFIEKTLEDLKIEFQN